MDYPKVLVACPTNVVKNYAMRRWIDNVKSFTYPNHEVFMVDNSPSDAFYQNYTNEINIVHVKSDVHLPMQRITQSMEVIRKYALKNKFDFWFNIEIDVIPQDKDIVEKMVDFITKNDLDLINHAYPGRWDNTIDHQGIGFSIMNHKLFSQISFEQAGNVSPDGFMWGKVRKHTQFRMIDLWNYFPVKHLIND